VHMVRSGRTGWGRRAVGEVGIYAFRSYLLWGFFFIGNMLSSEYVKNCFAAV